MKKEVISKLLIDINEVTDMLYQQMNTVAFQNLNLLLNEIEKIMSKLSTLKADNPGITYEEEAVNKTLNKAMRALEHADTILLADILKYDLTEHFELLVKTL